MKLFKLLFTNLTLLFLLLCSSFARSENIFYDKDFSVNNASAFKISLLDDAKEACWTNLKETREYAEEKLKMLGGKIEEFNLPLASNNQYQLQVHVQLSRIFANKTGPCFGSISMEIMTYALVNDLFHKSVIVNYDARLLHKVNLNQAVITALSEFFSDLK